MIIFLIRIYSLFSVYTLRNEEFFMEKKSLEEFQNKIFMLPK